MTNFGKSMQKGSMMVEALALLGLITMVTPILYKKAAERTTELQDINVATQMRMLSGAADDYIADNYNEVGEVHTGEVFSLSDDELEVMSTYLPHGFNMTKSKMFKDYKVSVHKREVEDIQGNKHNVFTTAVLAPLNDEISMMRSSKIASMIGANGGVYRASTGKLDGTQGTWQAELSDYGFSSGSGDDALKDGSLIVISTEAIASSTSSGDNDKMLYRVDDGDSSRNTMETILYMDGNDIRDVYNLISRESGGTIYIGKDPTAEGGGEISNLFVTGTTNLVGKLTAESDVEILGNLEVLNGDTHLKSLEVDENASIHGDLTVEGDSSLGNVDINGNLTQSGGDVSLSGGNFTADFEDIKMNASNNMELTAGNEMKIAGNTVSIEGTEEVIIKSGDNFIKVDPDRNTISGPTLFENGDVTINGGDLIVNGGEIKVIDPEGNPTYVTADWLIANIGVKLNDGSCVMETVGGVGKITCDELDIGGGTLKASSDTVVVSKSSFAVGGSAVNTDGNKINVNSTDAFIGYSYGGADTHKGLMVSSDEADLRMGAAKLVLNNASSLAMLETGDNARVTVEDGAVRMGAGGAKDAETSVVVADADKVGMAYGGTSVNSSLYLEDDGVLKFRADDVTKVLMDKDGVAFGDIADSVVATVDNSEPGVDNRLIEEGDAGGRKVVISRKGVLEIAPPTADEPDGGFIRARRLVSDIPYTTDLAYHGSDGSVAGNSLGETERYDYYQVNPAYTSVMNDIKLATRGGARLSDILSDFINKGVYIADNTYKATDGAIWDENDGMTVTNGVGSYTTECASSSCIASPWLGFVPTPQCPIGYARALSVAPIKWRMAEAYKLRAEMGEDTFGKTEYEKILKDGETFLSLFDSGRDPKNSFFLLGGEETLDSEGAEDHNHAPVYNSPLMFQINTWLNTTMFPYGSGAAFQGWHIVMGFLYWEGMYPELFSDLELSGNGDVFWNVFPVYVNEMASIANAYCVFDRYHLSDSGREWIWNGGGMNGSTSEQNPVYMYNQLHNWHAGYSKDDSWIDAVNDPVLGYRDAW